MFSYTHNPIFSTLEGMKHNLPFRLSTANHFKSAHKLGVLLVVLLCALIPTDLLAGSGIWQGFVVLNQKNTRDIFYDLNPSTQTGNSDFNGVSFGDFKTNEKFTLRGGEIKTYKNNLSDVLDGNLRYRVYKAGADGGRFETINLPYNGELYNPEASPTNSIGDQRWQQTNANVDLIAGLATGSYVLEVYMDSRYNDYNAGGPIGSGTNYYSNGGSNFVAYFTVSQGPLPVALTRFVAQRQENNVKLSWETASEHNNRGYEVQVSTDSRTFRALSFVQSHGDGTSTARNTYSYLDTEANKAGVRYYRLRQVDLDGTEKFYGPQAVSFSKAGSLVALQAVPNPFNSELTLSLPSLGNTRTGTVVLTDMMGRTALSQPLTLAAGVDEVRLPALNNLPTGMYHLRLNLNGELQTMKLLKK